MFDWAALGFAACPIILLTVHNRPLGQQAVRDYMAFQVGWCPSRANPTAINCTFSSWNGALDEGMQAQVNSDT